NPVSDKLYMNFPFGSERFTVSVFDTNGRLLQKQNGMTSELVSVDVSRLADGLYLLEAVTDRGESKIQRFLKQ
ncbi:MAG TPA: T9SS type A sorting domain-containing protein, partial [Flavobacteriaceae bacterium]|nr:T9SS type A sorting domain-containing protein [Flavobacteriaceae bacterium]